MRTQERIKNGVTLMSTLIERAHENASFKEQLISNPKDTIRKVAGSNFSLPDDKRIVVEDQTNESVIYFNIPVEPNLDEIELSDEELEEISGGSLRRWSYVAIAYEIRDFWNEFTDELNNPT